MSNPAIELRWGPGASDHDSIVIVPAGKYETLKEAVEQNKDKLQGAYLGGMDLRGADFRETNLRYADLAGTPLDGSIVLNGDRN